MKRYQKMIAAFTVILLTLNCGSKNTDDTVETPQTTEVPADFLLLFPLNNAVCQEGALVANEPDKLAINLQWEASTHASDYELSITNSETNELLAEVLTAQTNLDVTLQKATLYKWTVTAINKDKSKTSSEWSFYTKGKGKGNHVPYPAYNINFTADRTNDMLTIDWEASDEDDDTLTFDIKIFENDVEIDSQTNLQTMSVGNIVALLGATYYLDITVKDGASETSTKSALFKYN